MTSAPNWLRELMLVDLFGVVQTVCTQAADRRMGPLLVGPFLAHALLRVEDGVQEALSELRHLAACFSLLSIVSTTITILDTPAHHALHRSVHSS